MPRFFDHLDPDIRDILLAQIRNLWTHTSTALEGNTLSQGDTAFLLEEGLTIGGKPLKDHQEVVGHARAIDLLYGLLDRSQITAQDLFALHRAVQTEVVVDIYQPVDKWKVEPNFTNFVGQDGKQHWREYPRPNHIQQLMKEWLQRLNEPMAPTSVPTAMVDYYTDLHLSFVTIHPFCDGNGRMARLLANIPVLQAGFPPIVIPTQARQSYKKVLSDYQETIPNLAGLKHLRELPENPQKKAVIELFGGFWGQSMDLVANARAMQQEKDRAKTSRPPKGLAQSPRNHESEDLDLE